MRTRTRRFGTFVLIVGVLRATGLLRTAAGSTAATTGRLGAIEVSALEKAIAEAYLAYNT